MTNQIKLNGVYHNFFGNFTNIEKSTFTCQMKAFNWKLLGLNMQSIHHVHYYKDDTGVITSINIVPRRIGIKPEDIDVEHYQCLENSGVNLSDYQKLLWKIGLMHQDKLDKETRRNKADNYLIRINSLIEKHNMVSDNKIKVVIENE